MEASVGRSCPENPATTDSRCHASLATALLGKPAEVSTMKVFAASVCLLAAAVATTGCVRRVVERDTSVTPSATVVTTTPGTTVVTVTPAQVIACAGGYAPMGGTNFGACPDSR